MENVHLMWKIRRCGHLLYHHFSLGVVNGRMLQVLMNEGEMPQCRLAEKLNIQPASLSEMLDKTENDGLTRRVKNDGDRRAYNIILTEKGFARAQEAQRERNEMADYLFSPLNEDEKEQLDSLVTKLLTHWENREGWKHERTE